MEHHLTKYTKDGKRYVESWIQINVFGKIICFGKKKFEI